MQPKNKKYIWLLSLFPTGCLPFVFFAFFIPVFFMLPLLMMLNPAGSELQNDIYYQSITQVKNRYDIENDLSTYIVKAIDFAHLGDVRFSQSDVYEYIEQSFVRSEVIETVSEVIIDGKSETITEHIAVYYFLTLGEIIGMLIVEPYSFSEDDIALIQGLYFDESGTDITLSGKYPMPTAGYISSGYGERIDPLNGKFFMHPAIDIVPAHHAPVISIADGTVVKASTVQGDIYGNNVLIKHEQNGDVFYSFSAHLSSINVIEGQQLKQGDVIGLEGGDQKSDPNPGRTTGHHLHFEIWKGSDRSTHINPGQYIAASGG